MFNKIVKKSLTRFDMSLPSDDTSMASKHPRVAVIP